MGMLLQGLLLGGLYGLFVALLPARVPQRIPGFLGWAQLDSQGAVLVGIGATSSVGVSRQFVPLPASPRFFGAELHFQAIVSPIGRTPGFTNLVTEGIGR